MWQQILIIAIVAPVIYAVTAFVFRLLLRGFAPFIPSRPWVVNELLREMEVPRRKEGVALLAFSSGRSGFFHTLEQKYPEARLMAVESSFFPFLVAKVQGIIRRTRMEVVYLPVHQVPVKEFDFIYSHVYPDKMEGFGRKLKFECRPGTQVVSTGFNIPYLTSKKIVPLPDRKGRLDFLSRNQELFQSKRKKFKKEKKAFFYEI